MNSPNILIVEGINDRFSVAHLMQAYIHWGDKEKEWPVKIIEGNSINNILDESYLNTISKSPGLKRLGVLIDADVCAKSQWDRLRHCCRGFANLPSDLPKEGYTVEATVPGTTDKIQFGCWIMPDCFSPGMMETFLTRLGPPEYPKMLEFATASAEKAKTELKAPYKDAHRDKAILHTWLAWQDPPGERLGSALNQHILDPHSPNAKPFVDWFCHLFEISRTL